MLPNLDQVFFMLIISSTFVTFFSFQQIILVFSRPEPISTDYESVRPNFRPSISYIFSSLNAYCSSEHLFIGV